MTLRWRGQDWLIPGDLPVHTVLGLQQAAQQLQDAAKDRDEAAAMAAFEHLAQAVAAVLSIRQPEKAEDLTFGTRELGTLAGAIITALSGEQVIPGNAETAANPQA